jgi:hypothetical protein
MLPKKIQIIQMIKIILVMKSLTKDRQVVNNQHIRLQLVLQIRLKEMIVFCKRRVIESQNIHSVTL